MSSNGRLKRSELTLVQSNNSQYLSVKTARAYKRARKALQAEYRGVDKIIAEPAGAYRDFFTQGDMHVHPGRYNLNQASSASLASAGNSSHGLGTAFDLVEVPVEAKSLAILRSFGFTRTIPGDPNHFGHDGVTATGLVTAGKVYYTVKSGDILSRIAANYNTTVAKLVSLNKLRNANQINIGQKLRVK